MMRASANLNAVTIGLSPPAAILLRPACAEPLRLFAALLGISGGYHTDQDGIGGNDRQCKPNAVFCFPSTIDSRHLQASVRALLNRTRRCNHPLDARSRPGEREAPKHRSPGHLDPDG
jgi:hypothetical protein